MNIELSSRHYPTITTLREICKAVIGHIPSYEEDYETASLRSRRVIRFTDAAQPEWMTIREACRRMIKVGQKIHGEIQVNGVEI